MKKLMNESLDYIVIALLGLLYTVLMKIGTLVLL